MNIDELENKVFLGPMAGVTDLTFRRICRSMGCGVTCSEMISAKGLYYKDKKTKDLMKTEPGEKPYAIQIFGSEPEIMAEVAPLVEEAGADFLDINMGCPMPKIVNNGDGCALMKNPKRAGEIVRAVSRAVKIPVTVKIRKGWEEENAPEMAKILEDAGAAMIAVHGRTREEFYSGKADWRVIERVKNAVAIPVIGNGDIFSAEDAKRMSDETGCDGVMVARGAEGNPFIFRQIDEMRKTGKVTYFPTDKDKLEMALKHTRMLVEDKGEGRGIKEARKHIAWYIKGMRDSAQMKNRVFKAVTLAEIDELFQYAMSKLL